MNVEIIASGSSGNCAVIDKTIIIDAGVNVCPEGSCVLLTHHHTDHTKHLDKMGGKPIYCTQETADKLAEKFPYVAFNIVTLEMMFKVCRNYAPLYRIIPIELKHDAPCVGYVINKLEPCEDGQAIFFATDFNEIVGDEWFVKALKNKNFDALYIECNNTLTPTDFVDVYFHDENVKPPKDEFHRRKSFQNHCNADYLISLFRRAGYSETNRFTEPVTLLHKSSFYYQQRVEKIAELATICNVVNPLY